MIRRGYAIVLALASSALIGPAPVPEFSEMQALAILSSHLESESAYKNGLKCKAFVTEESAPEFFQFAVREVHRAPCAGDPNTEPVIDRFRVSKADRTVSRWEPVQDIWLPLGKR
jgi:hypothetical protein